jgi:hypothetical protein
MTRDKRLAEIPKDGRDYRRELEYLYARRSAIESLIRSLQQYERFRETGSERALKHA